MLRPSTAVCRFAAVLVAAIVASTSIAVFPSNAAAGTVAPLLTAEEQAHLDLLNDYRTDRGLPPLPVDARVQADARAWARTMAERDELGHDPALRAACFAASSTCSGWAENVGEGADHVQVFAGFLGSPGHAANMAVDAGAPVHVGVAVLRDGARTWVVQRFMRCDCRNGALAADMDRERQQALAFARALHEDFLTTAGTAGSLEAIAAPLAYGVDRRSVVQGLAYSDAWIGAMVDRFYRATLGRIPDAAGRAYWVGIIRSGRSPAEVAAHFFASDEYFRSVGGSNRAWVADLYAELLGRTGDAGGLDHWVAQLDGGAQREGVAADFYQSVESRGVRVDELFEALLGRDPDYGGLVYWIFRLADGHDVRLAVDLAGSDEYLERAVARFG